MTIRHTPHQGRFRRHKILRQLDAFFLMPLLHAIIVYVAIITHIAEYTLLRLIFSLHTYIYMLSYAITYMLIQRRYYLSGAVHM